MGLSLSQHVLNVKHGKKVVKKSASLVPAGTNGFASGNGNIHKTLKMTKIGID